MEAHLNQTSQAYTDKFCTYDFDAQRILEQAECNRLVDRDWQQAHHSCTV